VRWSDALRAELQREGTQRYKVSWGPASVEIAHTQAASFKEVAALTKRVRERDGGLPYVRVHLDARLQQLVMLCMDRWRR
jgi:hypothetical protein